MYLDKNSIKIKVPGGSYISLGDYNGKCLIVEAKYGYNKLWASDSGRNLAGVQSGTLIGIFPKIIVQFKKMSKSELEAVVPILDSPKQIVSYYDPNKKIQVEMETYTGDYEVTNKHKIGGNTKNEGFGISFISVRKRS